MVVEHTELVVLFGGIPMKNTQVDGGGTGKHGVKTDLLRQDKGVRFQSLVLLKVTWRTFNGRMAASPPNTDTALMIPLMSLYLGKA